MNNPLDRKMFRQAGMSKQPMGILASSPELMTTAQKAMINRTLFYLYMTDSYYRQLRYEIDKAYMTYGDALAVRLNGTSDINYKDLVKD